MNNVDTTHCTICGEPWTEELQAHDHSQDTPKKKYPRRVRNVSIAHLEKMLRTVLARECGNLMVASAERALERDESVSLRGYIQLINELKELDQIKALENKEKENEEDV